MHKYPDFYLSPFGSALHEMNPTGSQRVKEPVVIVQQASFLPGHRKGCQKRKISLEEQVGNIQFILDLGLRLDTFPWVCVSHLLNPMGRSSSSFRFMVVWLFSEPSISDYAHKVFVCYGFFKSWGREL